MLENKEERDKQLNIIEELRESGRFSNKKYFVETFGCQMNAHDSEKFIGILKKMGLTETDNYKEADIIMYNTCAVRDNAERKVWGRIGNVKRLKEERRKKELDMPICCICGCMMQQETVIEQIKTKYKKVVDICFGTHNIYKFPELLQNYLENNSQIIDIWDAYKDIVEDLPQDRKYPFKACVNIMYGCNNFCTYCIVPYVRGRERSRRAIDIVREVEMLAKDGCVEVMLLGQNVNSYGKGNDDDITFAKLLHMVSEVEGIKRVRFMTSHPKDCSDELIEEVKNNPKVCKQLHLPVQSGSTKVMKEMNRVYTKESYLALIDKVKKEIPDVTISTDMIVGFPTETEEDFEETLDIMEKVKYDGVYSFIYSRRTGTPAAKMPFVFTEEEVSDRFNRLLDLDEKIRTERNNQRVGRTFEVLVEEKEDSGLLSGRTDGMLLVRFNGDESLIGKFVNVKVTENRKFYLYGELEK